MTYSGCQGNQFSSRACSRVKSGSSGIKLEDVFITLSMFFSGFLGTSIYQFLYLHDRLGSPILSLVNDQ